jgi:hypothetical protein
MAHNNDRSGLNNRGQVAYAFELADGTGGIAVWTPPNTSPPGDLNCDGTVNTLDISPFVLALTDPSTYEIEYPDCDRMLADVNGDGAVNSLDIDAFVDLLTNGG